MKCPKCRKQIPDGSKFCNHCGNPVGAKKKLYRRPDGLYEKIMKIDGKRVAFRAKKEADVYRKIREYESKKEKGITFLEAKELWYDEHWETLSPTTQKGYRYALNEITTEFGEMYIREISHKSIGNYMKSLPATYARKTCVTRLQLLNMIFKFAIAEDLCETNPCEYVTVPKGHGAKKRRAPTDEEIKAIVSSIGTYYHDFDFGLLATFLLYTGCRKGEALALKYSDLDFKKQRMTINKSVYFVHNEGKIKTPKTEAGIRTIIIPSCIMPLLPRGKNHEFIFSPSPNEPMRGHFFERGWQEWQKQTGLDLTAHQLRHGYATILLEADIGAKDVQDLLGHADVSTTLNIYTDVNERRKLETQTKLNQFLQ